MDGVSHQFFAGARLAINQHTPVRWSHEANLLPQSLHRNAVTDDNALRLKLLLQINVLAVQLLGFDRVFNDDQRLLDTERLFEKVVGAEFGGAYCGFNRAVARNHHHFGRIVQSTNLRKGLEAVHSGQPDVEQDDVEGILTKSLQALLGALDG